MELVERQRSAHEYLDGDRYDEAIALYEQCIEATPKVMSNYWFLGLALLLQGQESEAHALWLKVIVEGEAEELEAKTEDLIKVLEIEGIQRLQSAKFNQAEKIYRQIIETTPDNIEAYTNLGIALFNQGKGEEAIACYQQALQLDPNDAIAHHNLMFIFHHQKQFDRASNYYQEFLSFNPNVAAGYNNLGYAFQMQGEVEEAISYYQQSLDLNPIPEVYNNLGTALMQGCLDEALSCFQQALKLDSNYALTHYNMSVILQTQGKLEEAIACLNRTLEIDPNHEWAQFNRAYILLQQGNYKSGFASYNWWVTPNSLPRPHFSQPLWNGSSLSGSTILLHLDFIDTGFGDIIHFIRYIPLVAQRVGFVVVECQEPLVKLLTTVPGIHQVVAFGAALPPFDVQAPLLSLPKILGTTLKTVPAQIPYLTPPKSDIMIKMPPNTRLKVGIVWASGYREALLSCIKRGLAHYQCLFSY